MAQVPGWRHRVAQPGLAGLSRQVARRAVAGWLRTAAPAGTILTRLLRESLRIPMTRAREGAARAPAQGAQQALPEQAGPQAQLGQREQQDQRERAQAAQAAARPQVRIRDPLTRLLRALEAETPEATRLRRTRVDERDPR